MHALLRGDTGEPFESIGYDWREHGDAIRGEDDEQPWNAAKPLSGADSGAFRSPIPVHSDH